MGRSSRTEILLCGGLASAAILLRFYFAWHSAPGRDLKAFSETVALFRGGSRIYEKTSLYNYSPLWLWMLLGLERLSVALGLPFEGVVRSFLATVDAGCAVILFRIAASLPTALSPWRAIALYLLNPVVIVASSIQGQFDTLSLFFLLGAVWLSGNGPRPARSRAGTALFLTLSVATKQMTVFHPVLWWRDRRSAWLVAAPYLVNLGLFLPYASQWRGIRDHVLFYRSVPVSYGFSEWVLLDSRWALPLGLFSFCACLAAAWALRGKELPRASLLLFLVLLFFAPGFGAHYLVWPLTIGSLYGGRGYLLTIFFWAVALAGNVWGLLGTAQWTGHLIWLAILLWGIEVLRLLRPGSAPAPA